ncbi:MAG: PAS domain S-box protein [Alphaproteobacteria bacterium]|nr:PAS domain S-box protein [Alphaproteobacteria bacterium]
MTDETMDAPKPIRLYSLRRFISLRVSIATVVSCAVLLAIVTEVVWQRLYHDAMERVRTAAVSASDHLDREMHYRFRDLGSAGVLLSGHPHDDGDWGRIIEHLHQAYSDYSWVALVAPDGIVRVANRDLLVGQSVAERPWFAPSLEGPYIGDVHEAVLLSKLLGPDADGQALRFVDFGFPMRNEGGEVIGVLAAHLNWSWAKNVLAPFEPSSISGASRDVMILDSNGIVLHGPADFLGRKYDVPLPTEGVLWGEDFEGRVYAVARTKGHGDYPGLGWSVVIRAPDGAIYGLANAVRDSILLSGIPVTAILLLTALLISRRIASPIEKLTRAVLANSPIPQIQDYREAADLAKAFETLLEGLLHNQERIEAEVVARTTELHDFLRVVDAHAIVSMSDGDGAITYANDLFCRASGYTRAELLGRNHNIVRSERHDDAFFAEMWQTIARGEVWQGTICNKTKDGREYWVRSTIAPTSHEGSPHRYISIRTDITGVINDQERLATLNRELGLFKRIIESTTEAVTITDAEARVVYSNPARERLYGRTAAEMTGSTLFDTIPSSASHMIPLIRKGIDAGTGWSGHLPIKRHDGTTIVSSSNIGVVKNEEGRVQFIFNVFHDFTPELAQRMELDNARHAAEVANRAKSEFLSNMSHELRTPLNAVIGFSQVLLSGTKNPLDDKQKAQLGYILAGGEHLLELINEVLDLAKIEAGGVTLNVAPLHLRAVVEECLSLTKTMRDKYEVSLSDTGAGCMTMVRTDPLRAKQLILNLLSNAAKYNRRGGTIHISCERADGRFHRLVIADTGYGIPEAKQAEMFKPFSRLGAETTEIEGTGIGLVLTKTLIEAMGGRIGFSSVEGEGSRFWLDFPIVETAAAEPDQDRNGVFASDGALHFCAEDHLVLYVEDNPANLSLMEALFEQLAPMRLITASTGEEGLQLAESEQPDVILLDISLPSISGLDVARHLKSDERTRHIPVVALSADATPQATDRALESGCDTYLTKPVDISALVRTLQHVMRHLDAHSA